ncbi:P-loop containing nucleoside triphosphate hydrolase protein [Pavlovales sp. CCMP2436]|nr:P-loop containing nucleoside triphosphate hydrolase protein [Pavlovales sp. CCMP2436]
MSTRADGKEEEYGRLQDKGELQGYDDVTTTFEALGLAAPIVEACKALGYTRPTPIQAQAIPYALAGRDIIGLAETGSGKTAAFALPMLNRLLEKPQPFYALVIAPTRELAFQISEQIEALGSVIAVKCVTIVGGIDMMTQALAIAKRPHVLVGSPGRVVDHLQNTKGFSLRNLKVLVLDEADKLLAMDFEKEIDAILKAVPQERSTYLFSATMTSQVAKLQRASLINPVRLEVSSKYQTVSTLQASYLFVPAKHKDVYFAYLMNELAGNSVIVFTHTCATTQRLALLLRALGFAGERSILLATDVASRGLDIPSVDAVVNYDVPVNSKDYIHRVGRTARAGRSGRAVTLVSQYDVELYQRIEYMLGE